MVVWSQPFFHTVEKMKKLKCLALCLLVGTLASLALAADVKPLYFDYITGSGSTYDSLQQEEWEYLMKFKMFGTNGITFGNEKIRVTDSVGWFGTSKGSLNLGQNGKDTIGGPILVGVNLTFHNGPDVFTTGPLYVNGNVVVTEEGFKDGDSNPEKRSSFAGDVCVGGTADSKFLKYVDDSKEHININNENSGAKCPDTVPSIKTSLAIPKLGTLNAARTLEIDPLDNQTFTITVPEAADDSKAPYDIHVTNTITMSNASKIVIQQPAGGRLTRIFVDGGFNFRSSSLNKIVVAYKNENGGYDELANEDYLGTLLFYTTRDIEFPSMDANKAYFQGSFITTGTIDIKHHLVLAGQVLANNITIDTDFDGSNFIYVPFDPPVLDIDPQLLNEGRWPESDLDSLVPIHLDTVPATDVKFSYCFAVDDTTRTTVPAHVASLQDFRKTAASKFPVCGTDTAHVLIKEGKLEPTEETKIRINVITDTLTEGDENLTLKIFNLAGAVMPGNKKSGEFVLKITDQATPKFNNDDTGAYPQNEKTPNTPVANGDTVKIIALKNMKWERRDSILVEMRDTNLAAGAVSATELFEFVLDTNETTHSIQTIIKVKDASLLNYERKPHDYQVVLTLKYKKEDPANPGQEVVSVVDTLIRTISIVDVNEAPTIASLEDKNPTFAGTPTQYTLYPNENLNNEDSVGVVHAFDIDSLSNGRFDHLVYSIESTNPVPFKMMDSVIVVDGDNKLNYEVQKEYTFDVVVTNCDWDVAAGAPFPGGACLEDRKTVTVKVQDVNEPPVIIKDDVDHYDVDENKYATGDYIVEFEIQDVDDGDLDNNIVVSMSDDNNTRVDTLFRVGYDKTTHKIYVQVIDSAKIDFEKVQPIHKVTITVSDGEFQDTVIRTINIIDVNETPTITGVAEMNADYTGPMEEFTLYPKENLNDGDSVGIVLATDPDSLSNGKFNHLEFSIVSTNPVPFKMKGDTIVVDGDNKLDYEGTNVYTFDVMVSNCEWDVANNVAIQGGSCLEDVKTVTVKLQDVNEPPVIIKDDVDHYDVDENKYATGTHIAEFEIQDVDAGNLDSKITVSVSDDNSTGVESLFEFGYDKTTHKVYVAIIDSASIDYEAVKTEHKVTITVTDGEFQDTIIRAINIIDVNEAPNIDQIVDANGDANVLTTDGILKPFENMKKGQPIGTIVASDPDIKHVTEFGHLEYILVDNPTNPVPFELNGSTIVVMDSSAMNAELNKEYTFDVKVKNCEWDVANNVATDRCLEDVETIRVQIQNVPEHPVISCKVGDTNCNGPYDVYENSKKDPEIHAFVVTDEDKNQVASLTATVIDTNGNGADSLFQIVFEEDATGDFLMKIVLARDSILDYETLYPSYDIMVIVKDVENLADTIVRTINIIDVNEVPNIDQIVDANGNADILTADGILKPFENIKENDTIGVIVASDPDTKHVMEFGHLEYILVDNATDPVPFKMVGSAIVVMDSSAMNAELDKEYTFDVKVKNCEWDTSANAYSTDRCLEDVETIRVQIQNVPEEPVITCKTGDTNCDGPYIVIENSKKDSVIHEFVVTDDDHGQVEKLVPTLEDNNGGNAADLFKAVVEQDTTTGEWLLKIEVKGDIDYESIDSVYSVKVTVKDADSLSASIVRVLNIKDVNEAPTVDPFNETIEENLPDSTKVGELVAADPDTKHSEFSQLTYKIIDENIPFYLDSNVIKVADSEKLDFETKKEFSFYVEVSDGEYQDTAKVTIKLKDMDENPKIIVDDGPNGKDDTEDDSLCVAFCDTTSRGHTPDSILTVKVLENVPDSSIVFAYVVSDEDRDEVARLKPSMKDNNGTGADSIFAPVMKKVGDKWKIAVIVKDSSKLDYEKIAEEHEVTIFVTDSTGLQDSIVRIIRVIDVNEAPTVEQFDKLIEENLPDSAVVGELVAADPDSKNPDFRKLTYRILDEDVPFFLDSNVIRVGNSSELNYEKNTSFSFYVEVSDGEFQDTAKVTIGLDDVDESPKIITDDGPNGKDDTEDEHRCVANCDTTNRGSGDEHGKNILTVGIDENVKTGTPVLVYRVYDEDADDLDSLKPSLVQMSATVDGSSAEELFAIDMVQDSAGWKIVVSVKDSSKLDYEALRKAENNDDPDPEYTVRIIVSEPEGYKDELKDTIIRVIRVQDVNENPIFDVFPCEIAENNEIGDSLGRIEHPTDPDSLSKTIGFYNNVMELVGGDTALFALDTTRGPLNYILTAKVEFDCESRDPAADTLLYKCGIDGAYHVVVNYYDPEDPSVMLTKDVPVTLIDVNEKPKITTDSVEVKENVKKGTVVDTIKATDPDVYDSVLTYTLVEDKSGCFEVSKRGVITVKKDNCPALDYEENKELPITVKVTDNGTHGGGEETLSDTKTVIVKITDVNEAPKIDDKTIHVSEDAKVKTPIDTVTATDPDKNPEFNELVYRIVKGDTSVFKIDSVTGVITLKDSLDYESTPEYTLMIEVDDGEFTDTAKVTVKVDNVVETPKVEIILAETTDSTWKNPDTLYINTKDLCIEWTAMERKSEKVLKDSSECGIKLDEGENIIIRKFDDPSMDYPGFDTLVVYVSTKTPIVTIRKADDERSNPNIFTVVEQSAKADTAFYVNDPSNEIIVTVKDPVEKTEETFSLNVDLDTVTVPSKTYKTVSEITEFGIALNENPSSGATHTPVNGEKIAVTYTEKVNGKNVQITYYTDNDGEVIKNADGVEEITVTYTEKINGIDVKISYQADAATGAVIKTSGGYVKSDDETEISSSSSGKSEGKSSSSKGGKSSSSSKGGKTVENEVVYTISYETVDEAGNVLMVSYGVDAEGNIVKNENGCVGYELTYSYTNKYGNTATQSLFIVLDQVPPEVKILYPTEGEIIYSNYVDVKWTVDIGDGKGPIVQDTLVTQSLDKGGNAIVRFYRDKAGNTASDTVRVVMKNAKDMDIAVEQPVTQISKDKVAEYYATNEPEENESFAVSIYNPKTGKEVETLVGGDYVTKEGSGDVPYPGFDDHLGPTLGIETKVPSVNAVGGLATLDDIVKDGLVMLEDVDADNSIKIPVEEYVEKYCSDEFAEKVGADLSSANLYKTKMYVKIWIYTTLGSFVDYYSFTQDLDNPDYANDAGLLTLYFEMKPDRDGNVRTQDGRLMATGAYIYKTEVEMKMELRCSLPPFDVDSKGNVKGPKKASNTKGTARSVTEDMLKSFGYKRPEKK